jgi:hypothetical protein
MSSLQTILAHVPLWAYVIFVALVAMGVRASRSRPLSLPLALAAPGFFLLWGVQSVVVHASVAALAPFWVAAAIMGIGIAVLLQKIDPRLNVHDGELALVGTWLPLIRNLMIFATKFVATYIVILRGDLTALTVDAVVSGLTAGYFLCWAYLLFRQVRQLRISARRAS